MTIRINENNIIVREATLSDATILLNLSNDEEVRKNSINTSKIEWEDHISWLTKKIIDNDYCIYLFFLENELIGQVKFDIQESEATISISIDSNFRRKGLSKFLLTEGIRKLYNNRKIIKNLIAYIKPFNEDSINGFLKVGFVFIEDVYINNELYNKYIFEISDNAEF